MDPMDCPGDGGRLGDLHDVGGVSGGDRDGRDANRIDVGWSVASVGDGDVRLRRFRVDSDDVAAALGCPADLQPESENSRDGRGNRALDFCLVHVHSRRCTSKAT